LYFTASGLSDKATVT